MTKGLILLCAGGTGGHLFPAEAVAHELKARGYTIHLAADDRVERFSANFPAEKIHRIKSATLGSKNPFAIAKSMFSLFSGFRQSQKMLKEIAPVAVAGFGGYPTVPPVFAASVAKIPTLVHEANAVLGRANRVLSSRVSQVAIGFGEANSSGDASLVVTGNPIRPNILAIANQPYPRRSADGEFNLLVFGGSQGAAFFGEAIPKAIAHLNEDERRKLRVVQQARAEDKEHVIAAYQSLGVKAQVESFFTDMPEQFGKAHLVISRAGASTVSELSVVGRPAMLVPYPFALDHDQASNAALLAKAGGATIHPQMELTPEKIAEQLSIYLAKPNELELAAEQAKNCGKPDATQVLADMLEKLATSKH